MVGNYKDWNITKIRMLFPKQMAERIIATPLIGSVYEDKMVYPGNEMVVTLSNLQSFYARYYL
jgi:hypothetical protein